RDAVPRAADLVLPDPALARRRLTPSRPPGGGRGGIPRGPEAVSGKRLGVVRADAGAARAGQGRRRRGRRYAVPAGVEGRRRDVDGVAILRDAVAGRGR